MGVAMSAKDALGKARAPQTNRAGSHRAHQRHPPHSNPAIHAWNRAEDGCANSHDHRRHVRFPDSWAPSLLRWLITPNESVRNLNHVELAEQSWQ